MTQSSRPISSFSESLTIQGPCLMDSPAHPTPPPDTHVTPWGRQAGAASTSGFFRGEVEAERGIQACPSSWGGERADCWFFRPLLLVASHQGTGVPYSSSYFSSHHCWSVADGETEVSDEWVPSRAKPIHLCFAAAPHCPHIGEQTWVTLSFCTGIRLCLPCQARRFEDTGP